MRLILKASNDSSYSIIKKGEKANFWKFLYSLQNLKTSFILYLDTLIGGSEKKSSFSAFSNEYLTLNVWNTDFLIEFNEKKSIGSFPKRDFTVYINRN